MDDRIVRKKIEALQAFAVVESLTLGPWEARPCRHLHPGEYEWLSAWRPVEAVSRWPALQTVWLRTGLVVPEEWQGQVDMSFVFANMEGLVWLRKAHDTTSAPGVPWAGLDELGHQSCPAPPPGEYVLSLEFISVPHALFRSDLRDKEGTFGGASAQLMDPEILAAVFDFRFAHEACEVIPDDRRRLRLEAALEEALLLPDLTASREVLRAQVLEARQLMGERIAQIASDPEGGRLFMTGHAHIDTAWLWPIRETVRKCARTFSTACRQMERYPEYRFSCPQPQLYAFVKQHYPALYQEIKNQVRAGRWETTGAMWVEADTNLTSGEALIRQILYGLRFFREEFGTRPTVCWLPDVFGFSAGLPQILQGCGIRSFWTWKLHWQAQNDFPYHLFWWEGVDGSRVLAHIPKLGGGAYGGTPNPQQLVRAWETNKQKGGFEAQLFPFGYGDGGGGATEEMLEYLKRARQYPGLPACCQTNVEEFFAQAHKDCGELPLWVGELYLETHRGTYTSQARTKRSNRQCELALRDLEIWGILSGRQDLLQETRDLWPLVLLHQFHDILPGSSIGEVYEQTARDHAHVLQTARAGRETALRMLSGEGTGWRVFNSLSWPRRDLVRLLRAGLAGPVVAACGDQKLPAQVMEEEVLVVVEVPSLGACTITLEAGDAPPTEVRAEGNVLENEFYRLELAADGTLERLYDKRFEREVLEPGQRGNLLQLFQDGPENEAAWNLHESYTKREYLWEGETTVEILESGPVRARARVTRQHRETRLVQDVCLYHSLPRIDFVTYVDWQARQTVLKAAFPLAVRAYHATYEVQFGALERPTHRNTSWDAAKFEVCAQRWADLSEAGYGVSLLNDCKYGYDCRGNLLRLTLLRGPEAPDPHADVGEHEFTYALLPHGGDWREGNVVREAYSLNVPLVAVPGGGEPVSSLSIEGPAILETLKPAEDGRGVIMRLYEPHGGRGSVTITHSLPYTKVAECNLVEEDGPVVSAEPGCFCFEIRPFEVKTFRLT